jgi:hypothetical protein
MKIEIEASALVAAQLAALTAMVLDRQKAERAQYDKAMAEPGGCSPCCRPAEAPRALSEEEIRAKVLGIGVAMVLRLELGVQRPELGVQRPELGVLRPVPSAYPLDAYGPDFR